MDTLLVKVENSLKNKMGADQIHSQDSSRFKTQISHYEEVLSKVKQEVNVLKHNELMMKNRINELMAESSELNERVAQ